MLEITVVWVLFAVSIGLWSWRRGHSGVVMFVVSLVASPVLGFVLEAMRGADDPSRERNLPADATKRCPACAKMVRRESVECRHCGERLGAPALVDPSEWNAW